jgi:hypothetical protein
MRIIQFPKPCKPVARPLLFTSPKCSVAIPVHDVLLRYALEQASLDSTVRSINYRTGPLTEYPRISLAGVVLCREDGAFLLRVSKARPERSAEEIARLTHLLECHGLKLLELDAHDMRREPLSSNARAIWSHAGRQVPLLDRLKIAVALEHGPQSIIEIKDRARPTGDVVATVCALACENLVRLNIHDAPLGPATIVLGP